MGSNLLAGAGFEVFEIRTSEIDKLIKFVRKRLAGVIMNFAEPNAERMIETDFRQKTFQISGKIVLFEAGWQ